MNTINDLHTNNKCVIVGNAWCPQSALIMEQKGFEMIGTTSWGIANLFGFNDGENILYATYFRHVINMLDVISIPLSVDIESGFSEDHSTIVENVLELASAGISGINIEDSTKEYKLKSLEEFSQILSKIRTALDSNNFIDFFINARIDTYVTGGENKLIETISRAKAYQSNGANGIFVPLMNEESEITSLLNEIDIPLNLLSLPNLTDISSLQSLGVQKLSFGNAMSDHMIVEIETLSSLIIKCKTTAALYHHEKINTKFHDKEDVY